MSVTKSKSVAATTLILMTSLVAACGSSSGGSAGGSGDGQSVTSIKISWQPAAPWALPMWEANKRGWWKEVGLKVAETKQFPAGAPQVAAGASGAWDLGATGSVPAVEAAGQYGLQAIGVSDQESALNAVMASKTLAAKIAHDPQVIKGKTIAMTPQSTGQWAVLACLSNVWHVPKSQVKILNSTLSAITSAAQNKKLDIWMIYTPLEFPLIKSTGAKEVCNGQQAGLHILGDLVATPKFAKAHPKSVAAFLAVFEHGVEWEKAHPNAAAKDFVKFAKEDGQVLTVAEAKQVLKATPKLTLKEQLALMKNNGGNDSKWHAWLADLNKFGTSVDMLNNPKDPSEYAMSKYMKIVDSTPSLKKFATTGD